MQKYSFCNYISISSHFISFLQGSWSSCSLPCGDRSDKLNVMVILPSTMYFTMRLNLDLSHIVERKGFIHRVCYSFHSSYIEVKDLVTYLQPKYVRPNVKPVHDETILKVLVILEPYKTYDFLVSADTII